MARFKVKNVNTTTSAFPAGGAQFSPQEETPPMTSSGPVFRALSVVGTCSPESDFSSSAVPVEALGSVRRLGRSQNLSCADSRLTLGLGF